MGTKSSETENVLSRGNLAQQNGKRGGKALIDELASSKHACWSYGEIRFTDSHGLNKGGNSPKKIVHFCVPTKWRGDTTYLVSGNNLYDCNHRLNPILFTHFYIKSEKLCLQVKICPVCKMISMFWLCS